ncbi:MAG: UDP-N-acetylglucosamine 1-carboxyvinyltransferase [Ruminococcaceae bacterium]|nr:UDP-N-acetylglucosamine 1-carboxyvinyltransferase [Oscillospiraceae bacterium]
MAEQQRIIISGGKRLEGEIAVQGAKNGALPLFAAAALCGGESVLHNCPKLSDCDSACRILECIGCKCKREKNTVTVDSSVIGSVEVPTHLMREMRSSIIFLGAILTRCKSCRLSFPGGCELGPRPIDFHLAALREMGAEIEEKHGFLDCTAPSGLHGAKITLSFSSVGATENIMLAASLAEGVTEIHNAAREPEITDLASFINKCGGKVSGAGGSTVTIEGVEKLRPCEHKIMPDRIAAATYLCCAAVSGGELILTETDHNDLRPVTAVLEQMGCRIYSYGQSNMFINAKKPLISPGTVRTNVHPGFPTDAQPPLMALTTLAAGTTVFVENIFENRFKHASELARLGARISVEGKVAVVTGVKNLSGAELMATDLRGGAALITAALGAEGVSRISGLSHIDRGYENIEGVLRSVGADIKRM